MFDLLLRRARLTDDTLTDIAIQDGKIAAGGGTPHPPHHNSLLEGGTYVRAGGGCTERERGGEGGLTPARGDEVAPVHANGGGGGWGVAPNRRDLPVLNGDIGQGIVGEARTAQE